MLAIRIVVPLRYCHSDSAVGAVVPDRIHYEIVNEALQQGAVCLYARPGAAALHPYADMPGQVFHELQLPLHEVRKADFLHLSVLAVVNPREQKEAAVQTAQPGRHLIEALDHFSLALRQSGLLQEHIEPALEYGKRSLQLVGCILGEFLLYAVAGQAVAHQAGK